MVETDPRVRSAVGIRLEVMEIDLEVMEATENELQVNEIDVKW